MRGELCNYENDNCEFTKSIKNQKKPVFHTKPTKTFQLSGSVLVTS